MYYVECFLIFFRDSDKKKWHYDKLFQSRSQIKKPGLFLATKYFFLLFYYQVIVLF